MARGPPTQDEAPPTPNDSGTKIQRPLVGHRIFKQLYTITENLEPSEFELPREWMPTASGDVEGNRGERKPDPRSAAGSPGVAVPGGREAGAAPPATPKPTSTATWTPTGATDATSGALRAVFSELCAAAAGTSANFSPPWSDLRDVEREVPSGRERR